MYAVDYVDRFDAFVGSRLKALGLFLGKVPCREKVVEDASLQPGAKPGRCARTHVFVVNLCPRGNLLAGVNECAGSGRHNFNLVVKSFLESTQSCNITMHGRAALDGVNF